MSCTLPVCYQWDAVYFLLTHLLNGIDSVEGEGREGSKVESLAQPSQKLVLGNTLLTAVSYQTTFTSFAQFVTLHV